VERDGERVDVGMRVGRLPAELFGRHVRQRPEPRAGLREAARSEIADTAEVREPGPPFLVEEDVVRLHVPVDQPNGVGALEEERRLDRQRDGVTPGDLPLAPKSRSEGAARHERHGEVELAPVDAGVMDCDDAAAAKSGHGFGLPAESDDGFGIGRPRHDLERTDRPGGNVSDAVHAAHAAVPELAHELVRSDRLSGRRGPTSGRTTRRALVARASEECGCDRAVEESSLAEE
jgi:hypothetical protein